jgi:transcriptional regulator with XRE-family HTH domain
MSARGALGTGVRRLRKAAGMRTLGLAMAAGLPVSTIWAIEVGVRDASPGTLRAIAEALAAWSPNLGSTEDVLQMLMEWAGTRMAPEGASPRVTLRQARSRNRRRRIFRWLDARGARGWQSHG